jgi:hypothetical protein
VSSGATIIPMVTQDICIKVGDQRVGAQGEFLSRWQFAGYTPEVLAQWETGYVMPYLMKPRITPTPWNALGLLDASYHQVEPNMPWDTEATWILLSQRLPKHYDGEWATMTKWHHDLVSHHLELARCLTHGDPTLENVLQSRMGRWILCDPIPARTAVPDMRSVDLGKVLQSTLGYDAIIADVPYEPSDYWLAELPELEALAARYWCVIHVARCRPYLPQDIWREVADALLPRLCGV